jgi:hypothetical protein
MIACEGTRKIPMDPTFRNSSGGGRWNWETSVAVQFCRERTRFTVPHRGFGKLAQAALQAALGIAILAFAYPLLGQVAGGTIQGTVTDSSGRVITEAKVSIKNLATGLVTAAENNDQGLYTVPNLVPGSYDVSCAATGFATSVYGGVALNVGAQPRVDFVLKPGTVKEVVVVQDLPPSIDFASSTLSNVVDQTTVRELPLNGRDWTQLATLETGVAAVHTQVNLTTGPDRGNRGFGQQLTISGGRPAQNNYRLDGVSINDYSNGAPGSVLGSNLGVDAVEEFSVLTSNYSAEYGRTSGGVINAVTKSGTGTFHGTAYEFLRNSALDAKNYFDPPKKPPFKRNQFGASAGGPLIKNRTFLFGDYEGDRQSTGISSPIAAPTNNAWNGLIDGAVDPRVLQFRGLYPVVDDHCVPAPPPQPPGCPDTGTFLSVASQVINENYFTIRGDHKLSSKASLVGTYVFDKAVQTQPDPLLVLLTGNSTKRQIATAEYTRSIQPTFVNSVRFGFNRVAAFAGQNASAINPLATDTTLGVFTNQPTVAQRPAPGVVVTDGSIAALPGGLGASPNYRFHWNSFQLYDDAFITKGIHFLRFGFATEYIQDNILASSDANGVVRFNTLPDFFHNSPHEADFAVPGAIRERQIRQHLYAGYIQDDIRALTNLTLNAGLRYEMTTVPTETQGLISTLINPTTDTQPHTGNPFFLNPTYRNFEPRVGFAWDPLKNGRTAVRGGFGIFDVLPLPYLYELLVPLAAPFYQLQTGSAGSGPNDLHPGDFPGNISARINSPGQVRQSYVQHDPKRNYVMQWNLNIQREITKGFTGMVAYVGSRAVHQAFRADDINTALPLTPPLAPIAIFPGTDSLGNPLAGLMNPNVGQITTVTWGGDANYNALQAKLTAHVTSRFQAQASYTWGKAIDTGSATVGGDTFSNSISSLPIFNPALRRGLADFNITQNLVISYNWMLPRASHFGPVNWLLSDWQLGGVAQLSTGVPFTPIVGVDALGLGSTDPWDFPDRKPGCNSLVNPGNVNAYINVNCLAVPSVPASFAALCLPSPAVPSSIPGEIQCSNKRGDIGRNSLIGPPLRSFDFSLFKNFPVSSISEAFRIQFRIEMFNIFNHPNFAPPLDHLSVVGPDPNSSDARILAVSDVSQNNYRTNPGPGTIDSTVTSSRQIQFGLKVIW